MSAVGPEVHAADLILVSPAAPGRYRGYGNGRDMKQAIQKER